MKNEICENDKFYLFLGMKMILFNTFATW